MTRLLTRRGFVRTGGGLAVAPFVLNLGCGSDSSDGAGDPGGGSETLASGDVLLGLYPSADYATGEDALRAAFARLDFSWLGAGDSVLVKIAANSGHPHPATTAPAALRALARELTERGAGRVVVGEQSGVEYVRRIADGRRHSSTRELLESAGLLAAIADAGAEEHFFDDQEWDSWFEATPPPGSHWDRPLHLPGIVRDVDHIVYLPRLSAHVLAGYTHGHKLAVGWLRDDGRNHLHVRAEHFYEKYTEVSYVPEIRDRLRLVLTFAEKVLLDFGPDEGTIAEVDPRIVIASSSLASHDAISSAIFTHLDATIPESSTCSYPICTYDPGTAPIANQVFVTNIVPGVGQLGWGPEGAADYVPFTAHQFERGLGEDRCLLRAWEILGGRPELVRGVLHGAPPDADLRAAIERHGEGTITLG